MTKNVTRHGYVFDLKNDDFLSEMTVRETWGEIMWFETQTRHVFCHHNHIHVPYSFSCSTYVCRHPVGVKTLYVVQKVVESL